MRVLAIGAVLVLAAGFAAAADLPTAKPLPGNKPCPFPPEAQKDYVAGSVSFTARVRPDGTTESVEVKTVPIPGIGYEETVRSCVSEWRFEAAPSGSTGLREYDGRLRFRIDAAEEAAIRALLEALAVAWNAGEKAALEDLSLQAADNDAIRPDPRPSLQQQLSGTSADHWRMELATEVEHIRFLKPDVITVRQPYRRVVDGGVAPAGEQKAMLDAMAVKGARGWRFLRVAPMESAWLSAVRVGGKVREPRKIKDARPRYPEAAKEIGVGGVVILECMLTLEGKVDKVRVLKGVYKVLDDAAIEAVRKWEYTPTLLDGNPVPVVMTVTVNFRLDRRGLARGDEGFSADR